MKTGMLFLMFYFFVQIKSDWIDPHDMNVGVKRKTQYSEEPNTMSQEYCKMKETYCDSDLYLKRLVSIILNNAHLRENNKIYHGHININFKMPEYQFLLDFIKNGEVNADVKTLRELNSVIELAIRKSSTEKLADELFSFKEKLFRLIINYETGVLAFLVVILYVIYHLFKRNFTISSILKYLFFLAYLIDWFLSYMHLRNVQEIKSMVEQHNIGSIPVDCQPVNMSWPKYLGYLFGRTTDCEKYHFIIYQNFNYLISPMKVFAYQFGNIVSFLEHIGKGFGGLGREMLTSLPWYMSIFLFPIMLASCCIVFIIVLVFATKTPVKLNAFHLFKFEFGESQQLLQLLSSEKITHRPLIEELSPKSVSTTADEEGTECTETEFSECDSKLDEQETSSS